MRSMWLKNRNRVIFLGLLLLCGFFILAAKLWLEQIEEGRSHKNRISRQSVRRIRIPAPRGKILTSDHHILATNTPSFDAYLYFEEMRQTSRSKTVKYIEDSLKKIYKSIERKPEVDLKAVYLHMRRPGTPFKIVTNLTQQEIAKLLVLTSQIKGLSIIPGSNREYPDGSIAAHIVGYTRPENPMQANDRNKFSYYVPDPKGVRGLELAFDTFDNNEHKIRGLKGSPGFSLVQVDHLGFVRQVLIDQVKPLPGNNIVLTLDYDAQKIASQLMAGKRGAFVLLNADTGAVLAMVSSPTFDLNEFVPRISNTDYQRLLKDPGIPLLDRALQGQYMPGSIIKPLNCLSYLNNGVKPEDYVICKGYTQIGNARIRCVSWRVGGHGKVNLYAALQKSCNDYMIEHALKIGIDKMIPVLREAGIGQKTGIELPERKGLLPSREYCRKTRKRNWRAHDTGLVSIGQGMIEVTPLQAAVFTAALANGGKVMRPHLLKEIRDSHGTVLYRKKPEVERELKTTPADLAAVQKGMYMVVNTSEGGGRRAQNNFIKLSGKTGTAEVGYGKNRRKNVWFICFGEYKGKRYALAVLVEHGTFGGLICAPLVKQFFSRWFWFKQHSDISP
ncbi:penicillin-binding protein 2 [Lentisphaerota bacterium ZTH]|nr:penicillin-binding protein 2 [Lentisphaerota bacterium]WET07586.1 penicillin-binding protein 2 [Lentisphaerota bacterium ZTH]